MEHLNLISPKLYMSNYEKTIPEESGIFLQDKKYPVICVEVNILHFPSTEKEPDVQNRQYELVGFVIDERKKLCAVNLFSCELSITDGNL